MYLFWESIIEPSLRALDARRIIEIGSDKGDNTRLLLDYCQSIGGFLEIIDPLPKYDPQSWLEPWQGHFRFHRDLSLNVLSRLDPVEVVLIDGDHNWYTVYSELKLLDKLACQTQTPFPLVLLHDVAWPYGRRDLYYAPENIPSAYLKPYRRMGMLYGVSELAENGGLNAHLCNSIYENNLSNGVLTAVEDFIAGSGWVLRLEIIPGFNGLGILYPDTLNEQEPFYRLMQEIRPTSRLRNYIEVIEKERVQLQIHDAERADKLLALNRSQKQQAVQIREADEVRLILEERIKGAETEQASLRQQLTQAKTECTALIHSLTQLEEVDLTAIRTREAGLTRRMSELDAVVKRYRAGITALERDYQAIRASARWRIGHLLVRLLEILLLRGKPPLAIDHMGKLFDSARVWEQSHTPDEGRN